MPAATCEDTKWLGRETVVACGEVSVARGVERGAEVLGGGQEGDSLERVIDTHTHRQTEAHTQSG